MVTLASSSTHDGGRFVSRSESPSPEISPSAVSSLQHGSSMHHGSSESAVASHCGPHGLSTHAMDGSLHSSAGVEPYRSHRSIGHSISVPNQHHIMEFMQWVNPYPNQLHSICHSRSSLQHGTSSPVVLSSHRASPSPTGRSRSSSQRSSRRGPLSSSKISSQHGPSQHRSRQNPSSQMSSQHGPSSSSQSQSRSTQRGPSSQHGPSSSSQSQSRSIQRGPSSSSQHGPSSSPRVSQRGSLSSIQRRPSSSGPLSSSHQDVSSSLSTSLLQHQYSSHSGSTSQHKSPSHDSSPSRGGSSPWPVGSSPHCDYIPPGGSPLQCDMQAESLHPNELSSLATSAPATCDGSSSIQSKF